MHGICTGHEIVKAAGANESQVVVPCLQVVYYQTFILAFFSAPQPEG